MRSMARLSRREFAAAAGAVPAALAQAPAPPPPPEDDNAASRRNLEQNLAALDKFKLPQATEPAFLFKA